LAGGSVLEKFDISGTEVSRQIKTLPEQIEAALDAEIPDLPETKKICICGVGTSAMAGDIISDYAGGFSDVPLPVIRGIDLPNWVKEDTTVIIISYSGDTTEMLYLQKEAVKRKCPLICLTSGGELGKRCSEKGYGPKVLLPPGMLSRCALGSMVGHLGAVLEDLGFCEFREPMKKMLPGLKVLRDSFNEENSPPFGFAEAIVDRIPVIYSLANMRSASMRWKFQINENAKMVAFFGTIPGFNHNEIIGWTEDKISEDFIPVVIYDDGASEVLRYMTDSTLGVLMDKGLDVQVYHVTGNSNLEKNLRCILLGDYVSLRLAQIRSTDPDQEYAVSDVREKVSDGEEFDSD
jgi:glucose/mannose-6-phosphate isomerase